MDKGMKFILGVLILISLASIAIAARFSMLEESTHQQYVELKRKLIEEVSILTERLEQTDRLKKKADTLNAEFEKQLRSTTKKLTRATQMYADLNKEHEDYKTKLNARADTLTGERTTLKKRIEELESDLFLAKILKEKVALEIEAKKLRDRLASREIQIRSLASEKINLGERLGKLSGVRQEAEKVLREGGESSELLSKQLAKEKREALRLSEDLEKIETRNEDLQHELNQLAKAKSTLEEKLSRLGKEFGEVRTERDQLSKEVKNLNAALKQKLAVLKQKLNEISKMGTRFATTIKDAARIVEEKKQGVELSPIVVKAAAPPFPLAARGGLSTVKTKSLPEGRILTVNNEYKFVVIDLGKEDGVQSGMSFGVYRDNKELGSVEIIEVHPGISAADIKDVKRRTRIKVDDKIVLRQQ